MKNKMKNLLFLLSGVAFVNSPALGMKDPEKGEMHKGVSVPYKNPLVEKDVDVSRLLFAFSEDDIEDLLDLERNLLLDLEEDDAELGNSLTRTEVNYDLLVQTYNSLRALGNETSNTELVRYLVSEDKWKLLPRLARKQLVTGVVKRAQDTRLEELMHTSGIISKYRSVRSTNAAFDEELIAFLVGEDWKKLTPDMQFLFVDKILKGVRELEEEDVEEAISQLSIVSKYRSTRASGNKASDNELVAFLFGEKWAKLSPEWQIRAVDEVTRRAHHLDLEGAINQSSVLERYRFVRAAGNPTSPGELVKYLMSKEWDKLSTSDQAAVVNRAIRASAIQYKDVLFPLIRSGKLEETFRAIKATDTTNTLSDDKILKKALATLGFEGGEILPPAACQLIVNAITGRDPLTTLLTFFEDEPEIAKLYRSKKGVDPTVSDQEVVKVVLEQIGYKDWDKLHPLMQTLLVGRIVEYAKVGVLPEWLRNAPADFDDSLVAPLFTEAMSQADRTNIIIAARHEDKVEDITPRIAVVAANVPRLFTSGMKGSYQAEIIRMALFVDADKIVPLIDAIVTHQDVLIPAGVSNPDDRANYVIDYLDKTAWQIKAIAANPIVSSQMSELERRGAIRDFSRYIDKSQVDVLFTPDMTEQDREDIFYLVRAIDEREDVAPRVEAVGMNINGIFTRGMSGYDKREIIKAALKINHRPLVRRIDAISSNAGNLFMGIHDHRHIASLTVALLQKSIGEIRELAARSKDLYLSLSTEYEQMQAIDNFKPKK